MHALSSLAAAAVAAAAVAAPASAQSCPVERIAPAFDATPDRFGAVLARDGARILITAPDGLGLVPFGPTSEKTGAGYIVEELPGGGFTAPVKLATPSTPFQTLMGLDGDIEADHAVLMGWWDSLIYPFQRIGGEWSALPPFTVAAYANQPTAVELENGRLLVTTWDTVQTLKINRLRTFEFIGGAWAAVSTVNFGQADWKTGDKPIALAAEGDRAYVATADGTLAKFAWIGGEYVLVDEFAVPGAGEGFGRALAVDGLRLAVGDGVGDAARVHVLLDGPVLAAPLSFAATVELPDDPDAGVTALAWNGAELAVGSGREGAAPATRHGRVHRFVEGAGGWNHVESIEPTGAAGGEHFGAALVYAPSGRLLVGAPGRIDTAVGSSDTFVEVIDTTGAGCASLLVYPSTASVALPPTAPMARVGFALDGPGDAAGQVYLLVAALQPASPGIPLGGVHLPLAADALLVLSVERANQPPFSETLGLLDGNGESSRPVFVGDFSAAVGQTIHVAWLAVSPSGPVFASEARALTFVP